MMNQELGPQSLTSDVLDSVFEMWWPKIEEKVKKIMANVQKPSKQSVRSERDILEEILARVRAVPQISSSRNRIHPGALEDLMDTYERLRIALAHLPSEAREELVDIAERLRGPIDHITGRINIDLDDVSPMHRERIDMMRRRLSREDEIQLPLLNLETESKEKIIKRTPRKH